MSINLNCNCWEIMSCDNLDCPARFEPETPCWEIAKRVDDYRNVSNTCQDLENSMSKINQPGWEGILKLENR